MSDNVNVPEALARINQLETEIARLRATVQASPMPVTQAESSPPPLPKVNPTQAWEGKGRVIGGILTLWQIHLILKLIVLPPAILVYIAVALWGSDVIGKDGAPWVAADVVLAIGAFTVALISWQPFHRRKANAVAFILGLLLVESVGVLVRFFGDLVIFEDESPPYLGLILGAAWYAGWTLYFLNSKRVRETFVN